MESNVRAKPITVKQTSKGVLPAAIDAGTAVSICLIKNSTDEALKYVTFNDFDGQPIAPYPTEIPSGLWAALFHSGIAPNPSESVGAVVYRCTTQAGTECDWMMSWWNIHGDTSRKVYTEIKEKGSYENDAVWPEILIQLNKGSDHSEASWENLFATLGVVPNDDVAIFKGIIKPN